MDGDAAAFGRRPADAKLDELFEVLADGHRRRLLEYLEDAEDDVAALPELVDHVADESADDRERVAVTLHHSHLPKLAEADIVEYDARSETVRYRGGQFVGEWVEIARRYESGSY